MTTGSYSSATYDVFLSYNRLNERWVAKLAKRLKRFKVGGRAISVFFAPSEVAPGESIPAAVSRGLVNSRHIAGVLSPEWVNSEWCELEGEVAVYSDPAARRQRFIPILLKECEVPATLRRLRTVDLRKDDDFARGVREIIDVIRLTAGRDKLSQEEDRGRQEVLRSPLLPWTPVAGPSFEFLWPDLFFDPKVSPRRRPSASLRFQTWQAREALRPQGSAFAVIGEPGVGKTTLLRALFLRNTGGNPKRGLFRHARQVLLRPNELVDLVGLQPRGEAIAVYVDGLDEIDADIIELVIDVVEQLVRSGCEVWLSCRSEHFSRRVLTSQRRLALFREILVVNRWEQEDVQQFIELYANLSEDEVLVSWFAELFQTVPGARDVVRNPLQLVLMIYLAQTGLSANTADMQKAYGLYSLFYDHWIRQERFRGTSSKAAVSQLEAAHIFLANRVYDERLGRPIELNSMPWSYELRTALVNDSAFRDLLIIEETGDRDHMVYGFRHDTISEFLIARDTVAAFLAPDSNRLNDVLLKTRSDDINRFIRSAFEVVTTAQTSAILNNLSDRYLELYADTVGRNLDRALRTREQLLYYIGRLPVEYPPTVLREAYFREDQPLLRRSAALGSILHGDTEIERSLIETMVGDEEEQVRNRSFQLVYFGDIDADVHTYRDEGGAWDRVRRAIYDRLVNHDLRSRRLRWWDMYTLSSFYDSRAWSDALSSEQRDVLASNDLVVGLSSLAAQEVRTLAEAVLNTDPLEFDEGISSTE